MASLEETNCDENRFQYDEHGDLIMPDFFSPLLFPEKNTPSKSDQIFDENFFKKILETENKPELEKVLKNLTTQLDQKFLPIPTLPPQIHTKFLTYHITRSLPLDYISLDPQRIVALHFALIGIDILNQLPTLFENKTLTTELIEFVYSLQLPTGGFTGSPLLKSGNNTTPGHLAATYSAVCILKTLGDDLSRVNYVGIADLINECVVYIPNEPLKPSIICSDVANTVWFQGGLVNGSDEGVKCGQNGQNCEKSEKSETNGKNCCQFSQVPLGTFYSSVLKDEFDVRFLFCAMVLCHIFNLWELVLWDGNLDQNNLEQKNNSEKNIVQKKCGKMSPYRILSYITSSQTYEGGMNLTDLGQEAHGGATHTAIVSYWILLNYLVNENEKIFKNFNFCEQKKVPNYLKTWPKLTPTTYSPLPIFNIPRLEKWLISLQGDGWRGRTNKARDCCYSYWLGSLLALFELNQFAQNYGNSFFIKLCENTQRGGFGRDEDAVSEILHSFYAIAGLSLIMNDNMQQNGAQIHNVLQMKAQIEGKIKICDENNILQKNDNVEIDEKIKKLKMLEKYTLVWNTQLNSIDPILGISYNAVNSFQNIPGIQIQDKITQRTSFKALIKQFNQQWNELKFE
jgi:prenyltransferase beta subunit